MRPSRPSWRYFLLERKLAIDGQHRENNVPTSFTYHWPTQWRHSDVTMHAFPRNVQHSAIMCGCCNSGPMTTSNAALCWQLQLPILITDCALDSKAPGARHSLSALYGFVAPRNITDFRRSIRRFADCHRKLPDVPLLTAMHGSHFTVIARLNSRLRSRTKKLGSKPVNSCRQAHVRVNFGEGARYVLRYFTWGQCAQ